MVTVILVVSLFACLGSFEPAEYFTEDVRVKLRPPLPVKTRIVIVEIGNTTLQAWEEPMVFWGPRFAHILKNAESHGARLIGLDFVFAAEADTWIWNELNASFDAASKLPRQPISSVQANRFLRDLPYTLQPNDPFYRQLENMPPNSVVLADEPGIPSLNLKRLRDEPNLRIASVAAAETRGGALREAILLSRNVAGRYDPSFIATIAALAKGYNPDNTRSQMDMAGNVVSSGADVQFLINYVGPPSSLAFSRIRAEELEADTLSNGDRQKLNGAIVLVAATYSGSNDLDRPVPGGYRMTGVEVNANAIDTLMEHRSLTRLATWQHGFVTLLAGGIVLLLLPFSAAVGGVIAVCLVAIWCLTSQILFVNYILVPVAAPIAVLGISLLVFHTIRSVEETLLRKDIETVFGRLVAPSVRDYLMENSSRLRLEGHVVDASVLFFDIRGSVAFAESHPAEAVFAELNRLFAELVPVVDRHGGLLSKFTGDGFMAAFGVPLPMEDHAQRAFDTAMEIVRTTRAYNEAGLEPNGHKWRIGCGVCSGRLVCGNVGVQERSEFTVIGMTPNLAARLESLNKTLCSEIVLAKTTYDLLREPPQELIGPREMKVAGLDVKVMVYYLPFPDLPQSTESWQPSIMEVPLEN